jgi:hypothetical protein
MGLGFGVYNSKISPDGVAFAFGGWVGEEITENPIVSGPNANIDGSTVPSDEVWIMQAVTLFYSGTTPTYIRANMVVGADVITIYQIDSPTSGSFYDRQTQLVCPPGANFRLRFQGATNGDTCIMRWTGYKIQL